MSRSSGHKSAGNSGLPNAQAVTALLRRAYELMFERHGHQAWWPGETAFEVCVGAILTQNTAWTNVERAIANLKSANVLAPRAMFALPEADLAQLIRPAGYFNIKARRLRSFIRAVVEDCDGELERLFEGTTEAVRERLLAINGIGPETADSMLLYAGGHHSFVIDAYTKRIFSRHDWWNATGKGANAKGNTREEYDSLKSLCERSLNHLSEAKRLDYWQDYHAQLVVIGKDFCRPRDPRCESCPLKLLLPRKP